MASGQDLAPDIRC